ncbi:Mitochondrial sodium/calcium exchanger protein [Bulinus truncatus]|nr:Mitochondrial sodium/calcium exchanger protein [Bulinus truncatus]
MADDDIECSQLHHLPNLTDICNFVKSTSSCDIDEGFINYIQILYCTLGSLPIWLACIILIVWWFFLFCGLAVTADEFFSPSMTVIIFSHH